MPSHSELSASSASRWMNCPASVRLSRGTPSEGSAYASEGTAAHELAARCLDESCEAVEFLGQTFNGITVTEGMADGAQIYVDHCRRLIDFCDVHHIEHKVSLEALDPPVPMYGTADFIAYFAKRRELHVVDLKFGKGVWVSAKDNPQTLILRARCSPQHRWPRFKGCSYNHPAPFRQGRTDPHNHDRRHRLAEWSFELMERAHATRDPEAPTVPGDWCKFCPVKGSCLAHQLQQANIAFHEFDPQMLMPPAP